MSLLVVINYAINIACFKLIDLDSLTLIWTSISVTRSKGLVEPSR